MNDGSPDLAKFFHIVHSAIGGELRSDGEYHPPCPFCGAHNERSTKFHYLMVYKCFVCGRSGGIIELANKVGKVGGSATPDVGVTMPKPKPKTKRQPEWRKWDAAEFDSRFRAEPRKALSAWRSYKPVATEQMDEYLLGYGVLPRSRCKHPRLLIPVFTPEGSLSCIRGRAIEEGDDGPKWLTSGGWTAEDLPLFNLNRFDPKEHRSIWIVENPIDAIMLPMVLPHALGVATLSVSYWTKRGARSKRWTQQVVQAARQSNAWVVVAYDNDVPGNGGGERREEWTAEWRERKLREREERRAAGERVYDGKLRPPPAMGPVVATMISAHWPRTKLFDWKDKPRKYDMGDLIEEELK